jgi:hypothetical protein
MIKKLYRGVVLLAGVTGLLALASAAAHAHILANHCEPRRR